MAEVSPFPLATIFFGALCLVLVATLVFVILTFVKVNRLAADQRPPMYPQAPPQQPGQYPSAPQPPPAQPGPPSPEQPPGPTPPA